MIGAILGDVVGSRFEFMNHKSKDFELFHKMCSFTDDSVCSIAVAETLLNHYPLKTDDENLEIIKNDLVANFIQYVKKYPDSGYGLKFYKWATSQGKTGFAPYNSWGNGSAMRVSSVGWLADNLDDVNKLAKATAEVTHNHPEGIKGAKAIASCIFLARNKKTKEEIKEYIYDYYYPEIEYLDYDELVKNYTFDVSCQGSVPCAIYAFLISKDFEDAIRTAVSIGGDTDTIACMTGAIAEAFYQDEKTEKIINEFIQKDYLPKEFMKVINELPYYSKK